MTKAYQSIACVTKEIVTLVYLAVSTKGRVTDCAAYDDMLLTHLCRPVCICVGGVNGAAF